MRWTLVILLFVLLGVVLNVAVAWGCALGVDVYRARRVFVLEAVPGELWEVTLQRRPGAAWIASRRLRGYAGEGRTIGAPPREIVPAGLSFVRPGRAYVSGQPYEIRFGDARGWPLLALWHEPLMDYHDRRGMVGGGPPPVVTRLPIRGGLETSLPSWSPPGPAGVPRILPLRPVWLGFLVNSAIYGASAWALFCGPFIVRRSLRRRAGRCEACGYDRRGAGTAACPECGAGSE